MMYNINSGICPFIDLFSKLRSNKESFNNTLYMYTIGSLTEVNGLIFEE